MEKIEQKQISLEDYIVINENAEAMGGSQIYLSAGSKVPTILAT